MTKRRNFTPEYKAEVVLEALRGETSQAELCHRHNISKDQLSKMNTTPAKLTLSPHVTLLTDD
ncbi:MAG: transposase [Candidatus Poribacteria bacterium]|nr:transposase [Candidatus Poribacteria bacterium]